MADNTTLNSGTGGDVIASDDIAGVKHQRVKVEFGADGSATDVSSANPLPVVLTTSTGVDIGDVTVANGTGASSVPVQGGAATDAAVAGNPLLAGARASAAAPTDMSADGDAVPLWATLKGALNVADGGGTLSVDDGGGALTVDGTVAVSGTVTVDASGATVPVSNAGLTELAAAINGSSQLDVNIAASAATLTVASHAVTNAGTFAVQESGSHVQVDDAAFTPATSKVAMAGFTFDDVAPDSVNEGDGGAARMSANRNQYVQIRDNAGNERGLNIDANGEMQISGTRNALPVTDNGGNLSVDWAGTAPPIGAGTEATALRVTVATDSTGVLSVDDNGGALTVDNGGTFAVQATVAAGATNIAKAEDAASADADVGVPAMAVRKATPANTSGTDGDYEMLQMSAGRLWTSATVDAALPAGTNAIGKLAANSGVDIGDVDILSIVPGTGATNLGKAEDAAHSSGDVGVMALAVRSAAPSERSAGPTDGDYEPVATNEVGAMWVSPTGSANGGLTTFMASGSDGSSILVATAQAIKASAGTMYGYFAYNPEAAVTFVHFYNTAAASVTVGTTNPLFTLQIPPASAANMSIPQGIAFSNAGWSCAATTTAGGNTAPATGVSLTVWYK